MGCIFDVVARSFSNHSDLTFLILIFAAIDFVIARILFKRDNMMTQTEMKREMKESFVIRMSAASATAIRKEWPIPPGSWARKPQSLDRRCRTA